MTKGQIEIRDLREDDWVWSSKTFLFHANVDDKMYKVYSGLAAYANNVSQEAFPGILTLAKRLHMGRSTVIRAIAQLEKYKFIRVDRELGKHNIYYLLKISEHSPPVSEVEPIFDWEKYQAKMLTDPRKEINIIGYFFVAKKMTFETKEQVEVAIKTHRPAALDLAAFDKKKIGIQIRRLEHEWPKFTLKTVIKELTK